MEAIVFFATIAPGTVIFLSGDKKRNENAWIARLELENFDNSVEFQKAARSNNYVIKCVPFSSILEKQFGRVAFRKVSLSRPSSFEWFEPAIFGQDKRVTTLEEARCVFEAPRRWASLIGSSMV